MQTPLCSPSPPPLPWDRQLSESVKAYAAFCTFRDLGARRSFVATARAVERDESLIRRWAGRFAWRERAYAWDLHCAKADEAAVRQEREELLRRQVRDADRLQRLAMARFSSLVGRDEETGELTLSQSIDHRGAAEMYRLALAIQKQLPALSAPASFGTGDPVDHLQLLSDDELATLIRLVKERTDQTEEKSLS